MYKYEFIAQLDMDEMIVPTRFDTIPELIDNLESENGQNFDSILFDQLYFPTYLPHFQ